MQALDQESQLWVEEQIQRKGQELQYQLNWNEVTLQEEAIEFV